MVLVQNWPFLNLFFLGIIQQENVFYDILEQKNAFLGYKNSKFKKWEKIAIFAKGLTHGFCPKLAIFPCFVFRQYKPGKCVLRYSTTKKRFLGYKNSKFKKWKNCDFSKGPMVLVQNWPFFHVFFF